MFGGLVGGGGGLLGRVLSNTVLSNIRDLAGVSNKIQREVLNDGDHIYSWRFGHTYSHHGIYIGNGKVIHFSKPSSNGCPNCGARQSNASGIVVNTCCLYCFLSGGELYRFEYGRDVSLLELAFPNKAGTSTSKPCDPTQVVLERAHGLLKKGFGAYDLIINNCETFAFYCKTGTKVIFSEQVRAISPF